MVEFRTLDTQLPSVLMWADQLMAFNREAPALVIFNNTGMSAHSHEGSEGHLLPATKKYLQQQFSLKQLFTYKCQHLCSVKSLYLISLEQTILSIVNSFKYESKGYFFFLFEKRYE